MGITDKPLGWPPVGITDKPLARLAIFGHMIVILHVEIENVTAVLFH